jgi:hypothetical protein
MMKMGRKYLFHPREAHIISRLDILMLYIIFGGFEKYRVSPQNPKELIFAFTKKHVFTPKPSRISVFHPRDTHILF